MNPEVSIGHSPLLLAQPHAGTEIPSSIRSRLNSHGLALADTDWHIKRLYTDLIDDVTCVYTPVHRYVIDANRDPADQSLYPGQNTTSLCPTTTFDGTPIYQDGEEPSCDEIGQRQQQYHQPYHDAIVEQLDRLRQKHGYVILYDCHSIRSRIPYLFDGKLPDFNIGSNSGQSCDAKIEAAVTAECEAASEYSSIVNGRFKGGWTTRHYGNPAQNYHAIQMELAQSTYMLEQDPWTYDDASAARLRVTLARILTGLSRLLEN